MYTEFQHLHSALAYLFLIVMVMSILYFLVGLFTKKPFTKLSKGVALSALIVAHVQLLVGIVLYFVSPLGLSNFSGDAMGDTTQRLYMLEHPLINIVGIALITAGYVLSKRASDLNTKYRLLVIYYTLGFGLVMLRIPWDNWP